MVVGTQSALAEYRTRSARIKLFSIARRYPQVLLGTGVVGTFVLIGLLAPWITPFDPLAQDVPNMLASPSPAHPFGRDDLGRDVLSRLIFGARVSMQVGMLSIVLAVALGVPIGLIAGFRGGWFDEISMRIMDAFYALPTLILAMALIAALGTSLMNAILAIGIVSMPRFPRLIRGEVLRVREADYIRAALVAGASEVRIIARHILPNAISVVIIQAALSIAFAILTESELSFLGLGVPPPTPSWGSMLRQGYPFLSQAPWLAVVPGAAITIVVLGFSLLGDGIRDLLDPRLRR